MPKPTCPRCAYEFDDDDTWHSSHRNEVHANDSDTGGKISWDYWSDLEISNKITELKNNLDMSRHIKINDLWHSSWAYIPQGVKAVGVDGNKFNWIPCANYCYDHSAMWPIIIANDISIQAPSEYFDEWYSSKLGAKISYCHKNPLRAAAIVFLEMNGVKP